MAVFERSFSNGREMLNTAHINDVNAHPLLYAPAGYKTVQTTDNQQGYWAKIGTVTIQNQFKHFEAKISFMSGAGTSLASRGEWFIKIIQNLPLGQAPVIKSRLSKNSFIGIDHVKAVMVENSTTQTKFELYVKILKVFDEIYFNPYHCVFDKTSMFVRWWKLIDAQPLLQTLPAGTTTDATHDGTFAHSYATANQAISVNTFEKVLFPTIENDYNTEMSNSSFVAQGDGIFHFNSVVKLLTATSGMNKSLVLYVNGAMKRYLDYSDKVILKGDAIVKLKMYDFVEVYLKSNDEAVTVEGLKDYTYLTVRQI